MTENNIMYIVMALKEWKNTSIKLNNELVSIPIDYPKSYGIGFLPVFLDPEKAKECYPESDIIAIQFKSKPMKELNEENTKPD
jgi:hypothetical protein